MTVLAVEVFWPHHQIKKVLSLPEIDLLEAALS
jgi:hypothetical protein